jgi:hypothetical protein
LKLADAQIELLLNRITYENKLQRMNVIVGNDYPNNFERTDFV